MKIPKRYALTALQCLRRMTMQADEHSIRVLAFSTGPRVALSSLMSASKSFSSVGSAVISSGSNKFSRMTVTYTEEKVLRKTSSSLDLYEQ